MSTAELKEKISKGLEQLSDEQLKSTYLVVTELGNQNTIVVEQPERNALEKKLAKGIEQLNNGEGTDFAPFLQRIKKRYGSKK